VNWLHTVSNTYEQQTTCIKGHQPHSQPYVSARWTASRCMPRATRVVRAGGVAHAVQRPLFKRQFTPCLDDDSAPVRWRGLWRGRASSSLSQLRVSALHLVIFCFWARACTARAGSNWCSMQKHVSRPPHVSHPDTHAQGATRNALQEMYAIINHASSCCGGCV